MLYRFLIAALVLLPIAKPAAAQDVKAAQTFLTGLYAGFAKGRKPLEATTRDVDKVFTPEMAGLIKADAIIQIDGVGVIDSDPICDCQDWDNLKVTKIDVAPVGAPKDGPVTTTASVEFTDMGSKRSVRYKLEAVDGKWRIANVFETGFPDLRKALSDDIIERAKGLAK